MKKFRNLPSIITLLAAFLTCIIMIVCEYSIISFLWVLVLVMVIFYSVGTIIRLILSRFFNDDNKKEEKELGEEDSEENASNEAEEQTENVSDDGNVKSGKK